MSMAKQYRTGASLMDRKSRANEAAVTGFASLPHELILTIADFLPESSVACLSLTCKSLYHSQGLRKEWTRGFNVQTSPGRCTHVYPCYPGIDGRNHEYVTFIRLLRKDMPGHLLCDYCQKFHPRRQTLAQGLRACPTSTTKGMWLSWPKFDFELHFEDVQKVMNRSRWGEAHGASLDSISLRSDWRVVKGISQPPFLAKLDVQPMISSGNLALHTCQRAMFTRCFLEHSSPWRRIHEQIANDSTDTFKVCKHMDTLKHSFLLDLRHLIHEQGWRLGYEQDSRLGTPRMYCTSCFTHYSATVFYHSNLGVDSGVEIALNTWSNLGQCEYASSPAWLTNAHHGNVWPARTVKQAQRIAQTTDKKIAPAIHDICATERCSSAVKHPSLRPALDLSVETSDEHTKKYHRLTKLMTEKHDSPTPSPAQPTGRWARVKKRSLAKISAFLRLPCSRRRQKEEDFYRYSTLV